MGSYDTVTQALESLKARGYQLDFNVAFDKLICRQNDICLNPDEFEIIETHRFEGNSNPDDEDVVYVVESKDGGMKGTITSAFGLYADQVSTAMISKLSMHK